MRSQQLIEIGMPGGETIRGDLHFTDAIGERAMVFVHGFASHRKGDKALALAEASEAAGWTFAAFDCRGHGESGGIMRDLRASRILEDLQAIRDDLHARGVKQLFLVGSSLGGFASAWFATRCDEVRACVLIAPAFRFLTRRWENLGDAGRERWRTQGFLRFKNGWIDVEVGYAMVEERHHFLLESLAERWTKPALIFHGVADDTVPVGESLDFIRLASGDIELRLLKNGDHRLIDYKDEIAREACRYFEHFAWRVGPGGRSAPSAD